MRFNGRDHYLIIGMKAGYDFRRYIPSWDYPTPASMAAVLVRALEEGEALEQWDSSLGLEQRVKVWIDSTERYYEMRLIYGLTKEGLVQRARDGVKRVVHLKRIAPYAEAIPAGARGQ